MRTVLSTIFRTCELLRVRHHTLAATAFIILCTYFSLTSAICYYPDGTTSPQDLPCQDTSGPSNCCGPEYECLSNKICRKTHANLDGSFANFTYGRGSCTDQSWRASQCPSFCLTQWSGESIWIPCEMGYVLPLCKFLLT